MVAEEKEGEGKHPSFLGKINTRLLWLGRGGQTWWEEMREGRRRRKGEEMALEDPLLTVGAKTTPSNPPSSSAYWGGGGEMEQAGKQPLAFRFGRSLSRESYGERGGKKRQIQFPASWMERIEETGKGDTRRVPFSLSLSSRGDGGVKRANRRQRQEMKKERDAFVASYRRTMENESTTRHISFPISLLLQCHKLFWYTPQQKGVAGENGQYDLAFFSHTIIISACKHFSVYGEFLQGKILHSESVFFLQLARVWCKCGEGHEFEGWETMLISRLFPLFFSFSFFARLMSPFPFPPSELEERHSLAEKAVLPFLLFFWWRTESFPFIPCWILKRIGWDN